MLPQALRRITLPANVALVLRFALAGLLNTFVSLVVTLSLDIGLHVKPALANAAGYVVGFVLSWLIQRRFVFRSTASGWTTKAKWVTTIALAFGLNQAVLATMPLLIGVEPLARTASQVVAMASYTVFQFVVLRLWVFRKAHDAPAA